MVFLVVVLNHVLNPNQFSTLFGMMIQIDDFWKIWDGLNPPSSFFSWNSYGLTGILNFSGVSIWFTRSLGPIPRWNTNTCCSCTPWKLYGSDAAKPAASHQNWCRISHTLPATPPSKSDPPISRKHVWCKPGWEFYDVVIHCYPISSHFLYQFFQYRYFNGHFRNLNWRYLPYIRPM